MKTTLKLILVYLLFTAANANELRAQHSPDEYFERSKKREGSWSATAEGDIRGEVTYEVRSNGSILLETLSPEGESTMITIYHLDGNQLMVTHYCSAGNQPRLVAKPGQAVDAPLEFSFLDATNLGDQNTGHMSALKMTLIDENHIQQEWTWTKDGQAHAQTFYLERIRG